MKKGTLIQMLVGFALGIAGGIALIKVLDAHSLIKALYAMLWLFILFLPSIIIHEGGHYVMGRFTGYKFVSFRIGSNTWVKQDGKLVRRKFKLAGTGGQCLLMPPESDTPENVPFFWYNFGGGFFNLLTALICIPIGLLINYFWVSAPFLMFGIMGIMLGIMNLVPLSTTVSNDGMNILRMMRDKSLRTAFYNSMAVNGMQSEGAMLSDISERYFVLPEDASKDAVDMNMLLNAQRLEERFQFREADEMLSRFINDGSKVQLYISEAKCERLFCRMAHGADKSEIESLYDKKVKDYVKLTEKFFVTRRKLLYLYDLLYKEDREAAEKEYQKAVDMKGSYPNIGEYKTEMLILEHIRNEHGMK